MIETYLQPKSLEELRQLLPRLTPDSVILAGGTDLMIKLRQKRPQVDLCLSLWSVPELRQLEETDGWLKIGAMVTHDTAARSALVERYFPGLVMACAHVGSQQIRNKGTLCGNVANASPAGDMIPCMYLYNAQVEILSAQGTRRVGIREFYTDKGRSILNGQEAVTALWLPIEPERHSCFIKLGSRTEVTIAQISVGVSWTGEEGHRENIRLYVGAVDTRPVAFSHPELLCTGEEEALDQAAQLLHDQIRAIRLNRTRESKLKLTEAEKLYKERAAKGILYDAAQLMRQVELKG